MPHTLSIDVTSAVKHFYPGLSSDDIELLSKTIVDNWDYSDIYNSLLEDVHSYATFNNVNLDGKDGVETN
tara:strand:- start:359 stop:568 length:210 start_codon:yes stop_codon:yes gene_type:complete